MQENINSNNNAPSSTLSNDLNIITSEINSYRLSISQSVFEIGKRLKYVRDHDLTHGQWIPYLESIGFDRSEAVKYIKVYERFPNVETYLHLSKAILFELLPLENVEEFIAQDHFIPSTGEMKKVTDNMTVKELKEIKKTIKNEHEHINNCDTNNINWENKIDTFYKSLKNVAEELQNSGLSIENLSMIGGIKKKQQLKLLNVIKIDNLYTRLYFSTILPALLKMASNDISAKFIEVAYKEIIESSNLLDINNLSSENVINRFIFEAKEMTDIDDVSQFFVKRRKSQTENNYTESFNNYEDTQESNISLSYKLLGVEKGDKQAARKQYRSLIKFLHPDSSKQHGLEGTEYLFTLVKEAYTSIL